MRSVLALTSLSFLFLLGSVSAGVNPQGNAQNEDNKKVEAKKKNSNFSLTVSNNGKTLHFDSLEAAEKSKDPEVRRQVALFKQMEKMMNREMGAFGADRNKPHEKVYEEGLIFHFPVPDQAKQLIAKYAELVRAAADPKNKQVLSKDMNASAGSDELTLEFASEKNSEAVRRMMMDFLRQGAAAKTKPVIKKNDNTTLIEIDDPKCAGAVRTKAEALMTSAEDIPEGERKPLFKILADKEGLTVTLLDPDDRVEANKAITKLKLPVRKFEGDDEADAIPLGGNGKIDIRAATEKERDKLHNQRNRENKNREERDRKKREALEKKKERMERGG